MFKDVEDKLDTAIRRKELRYTVMFLNVSVESLSDLFKLHNNNKNYISHLNKTINEDEDISINNSYIDT